MSDMSSSEKPEFCLPNRRGSRTFWVANGTRGLVEGTEEVRGVLVDGAYLVWPRRCPLGPTQTAYAVKRSQAAVLEAMVGYVGDGRGSSGSHGARLGRTDRSRRGTTTRTTTRDEEVVRPLSRIVQYGEKQKDEEVRRREETRRDKEEAQKKKRRA